QCRDMVGQPAVERRLARRVLAETGGDDVAHDALVDDLRIDAGPANSFRHHQRSQLGRGEALERAEELPRRRAHGGDDDGLTHVRLQTSDFRLQTLRLVFVRVSIRSTTSAPRNRCSRLRMVGDERMISRDHWALAVSTISTRLSSFTAVTRSIAGPTAAPQANVTLPSDSGAALSSSVSAPGRPCASGRM